MTEPITNFNLEKMIAEEPDPKFRILLLLVNSIKDSLVESNGVMRQFGQQLDSHLTRYEQRTASDDALKNQGKGAYRVAAAVIAIVQVIGMAIWLQAREDIKEIHAAIADGKTAVVRFEERLKALEKKDGK